MLWLAVFTEWLRALKDYKFYVLDWDSYLAPSLLIFLNITHVTLNSTSFITLVHVCSLPLITLALYEGNFEKPQAQHYCQCWDSILASLTRGKTQKSSLRFWISFSSPFFFLDATSLEILFTSMIFIVLKLKLCRIQSPSHKYFGGRSCSHFCALHGVV